MATNRTIFSRQPARILLVDLGPSFDPTSCQNLCSTLEESFSLICSLGGPCRVPFFGLFALGNFPDALFPLQHVRGNFGRIQGALEELKSFHRENCMSAKPRDTAENSIVQGLHEATAMFRRQAQSLLQSVGYWAQLEICIFTCESATSISKNIEKTTKDISMENLKKVQVVSLSNPERLSLPDELLNSQSSSTSGTSSSSDLTGLVDFITIDNDCLSLQNYFRSWLHDSATDKEHMHLSIPTMEKDKPLILKCDLQERVLSPALLPFHTHYSVHPEAYASKSLPTSSPKSSLSVPLYKLCAVSRIPVDAVCESVLYGLPLILRATSCWKIDWDELEVNQQQFRALCQNLNQKNEALLLAMQHDTPPQQPRSGRFQYQPRPPPPPRGHFLLQPSHSDALLLKAVAVNEILLPCSFSSAGVQIEEESERIVAEALDGLPCKDSYNPLTVTSFLHPSLIGHLTKNLPHNAPQQPRSRNNKLSRSSNQAQHNVADKQIACGRGPACGPARGPACGLARGPKPPLMESGTVWGPPAPPPTDMFNLDDAFPTQL